MAIHELDELTERNPSYPHVLAGDAEETRVRIEIPSKHGVVFAQCVVVHDGEEVLDVRLPDGHGALASAAGIPWEAAVAWEGFLEVLARMAFARGGR